MPVYKNKNNNSYYIKTYVTVDGKSKQITRRNKEWIGRAGKLEAEQEEIRLKTSYKKKNNDVDGNTICNVTYEQVFIENLNYKLEKNRIGKSTYNTVLNRNKLHVLPVLGNRYIHSISALDYSQLQQDLTKKLYVSTINGLHSDVLSTFKYAKTFYGLKNNVALEIGPLNEDRDNIDSFITLEDMQKIGREKSLSPDDWRRIVEVCEAKIKEANTEKEKYILTKDMLFFICEYILMMRIGEVQALSYDAIQFEKKFIYLNKAYSKSAKEVTPLKNRKARFVYLTDNILSMLKECLKVDSKHSDFKNTDYIFGWAKHYSRTNILRRLKKLKEEASISINITNHKLRHSIISNMLYEGQDPTAIATMAGHNKEMTFNVYNQVLEKANQKLVQELDNLYVPNVNL